jgi:hypothetical protein
MGVHDYSCFCHGEEGDQCLSTHEDCYYDLSDEGDGADTGKDLISADLSNKHETDSCGFDEAYIFIFEIPESEKINIYFP